MKKSLKDATDINVWESLKNDTFARGNDIQSFIEGLDEITESFCISLDAKWGEGKTFFVRQIEEVLKYLTKKCQDEQDLKKTPAYEYLKNCNVIKKLELGNTYLPVYFNAWLYDRNDDPLMSLLLVMTKTIQGEYNTNISLDNIGFKIGNLVSSFVQAKTGININALQGKGIDILSAVKTEEEIHNAVSDIFNDLLVENADKLIVFIDELDRCRPSFAIEMLERIKHYGDDDRIIFVVSVNKEQLVHTISNYYGNGFNATSYLNKFFDVNISLPPISNDLIRLQLKRDCTNDKFWMNKIAEELGVFYHLSLRDMILYKESIHLAKEPNQYCSSGESFIISLFATCVLLLEIVDVKEKKKFLEGESVLVSEVLPKLQSYKEYIGRIQYDIADEEEKIKRGIKEMEDAYRYVFGHGKDRYYNNFNLSYASKEKCISICNII